MMVLLLILNYFFLIYARKKNYIMKIFLMFLNSLLMIFMKDLTKVTPANWKVTKKEINTKRQKNQVLFQLKKLQSKRSECLKWLVKWFSICLFFPFDLFVKFSSPQDRHGMECSNRSSHGRLKQLCSKYSIKLKQKETDKLILTFFHKSTNAIYFLL